MEFILCQLRSLRARKGTISKRAYRPVCKRKRRRTWKARIEKWSWACFHLCIGAVGACVVIAVTCGMLLLAARTYVVLFLLLATIAILAISM